MAGFQSGTSDHRMAGCRGGGGGGLNSCDLEHANDLHRRNDGINEKDEEKETCDDEFLSAYLRCRERG